MLLPRHRRRTRREDRHEGDMVAGRLESPASARVILFADIVGSTALYDVLGDARAHARIASGLRLLKEVACERGGQVVAELGDEVMCFFDDPAQAAAAACEMHAGFSASFPAADGAPAMQLRIGMHYAPTSGLVADFAAVHGKVAHWAARSAKPEQTLATRSVVEELPPLVRACSRYVGDETLDVFADDQLGLYEILWDLDAITVSGEQGERAADDRCETVRFSGRGREVVLDAQRPTITVGRGPRNDLVLTHELVSREHLAAHFSRGRCTLTDRSTNGTFIITDAGTRTELRHDSVVLAGSGTIVLGSARDDGNAPTLRYVCT
jgi:class 3 adenylate cyclase